MQAARRIGVPIMILGFVCGSASFGQEAGGGDVRFAPRVDVMAVTAGSSDHFEKWMGTLPEDLRTATDARRWIESFWRDHGDPGSNFQVQFAVAMILGDVVRQGTSPEVAAIIRDELVTYTQRGGLDNILSGGPFFGLQLAQVLSQVVTADDQEGQQALLDIAATTAACPAEQRLSRTQMREAVERGAGAAGSEERLQTVVQTMAARSDQLIDRYRRIFGNSLSPDVYASLEGAFSADWRGLADDLVAEAADREFEQVVPAIQDQKTEPVRDVTWRQRLGEFRAELKLLVRKRGDVARVRRVVEYVEHFQNSVPLNEDAKCLVFIAFRRVLEARRPCAEQDVVHAIEGGLLRFVPTGVAARTGELWGRSAAALGNRASGQMRDELVRLVQSEQNTRLRKVYQQTLRRIDKAGGKNVKR